MTTPERNRRSRPPTPHSLPATFTEDDLWNHIVSKLGFDLMSRLRIHRTAPPLQWIEILCSTIIKETPNAG